MMRTTIPSNDAYWESHGDDERPDDWEYQHDDYDNGYDPGMDKGDSTCRSWEW